MSDQDEGLIETHQDAAEESGPDNFFIDILTGNLGGEPPGCCVSTIIVGR